MSSLETAEVNEAILLGMLASVYGNKDGGADTAVWLAEGKDNLGQGQAGIRQSSIAHQTIEALRAAGLLDDIMMTKEGLIVFLAEFY